MWSLSVNKEVSVGEDCDPCVCNLSPLDVFLQMSRVTPAEMTERFARHSFSSAQVTVLNDPLELGMQRDA